MLMLTLVACLTLGCRKTSFKGQLEVSQQLVFQQQKVKPGQYQAKLTIVNRKRVKLSLIQDKKKKNITLHIPKHLDLQDEGDFFITAQEAEQPYDIQGSSTKELSYSDVINRTERCNYQQSYYYCDSWGYCGYETRIMIGQQRVSYQLKTQTIHNTFNLLMADNTDGEALAKFSGHSTTSRKDYHSREVCHPGYGTYPHYPHYPHPLNPLRPFPRPFFPY